jgi:type VI secretion system protein ImpF
MAEECFRLFFMKNGFEPSLFDKLFDDLPVKAVRRRHSLDQLKDSVARDLEALLNTRMIFDESLVETYPLSHASVAAFGLSDFASLTLASIHDRQRICASIEHAIAAHESRLHDVRVTLEWRRKTINALNFSINAVLVVNPAHEPVAFDALLQPTNLQYSVKRQRQRVGL